MLPAHYDDAKKHPENETIRTEVRRVGAILDGTSTRFERLIVDECRGKPYFLRYVGDIDTDFLKAAADSRGQKLVPNCKPGHGAIVDGNGIEIFKTKPPLQRQPEENGHLMGVWRIVAKSGPQAAGLIKNLDAQTTVAGQAHAAPAT